METVLLATLADELGMDRSNMRKYVLKNGFEPVQVRSAETRNQAALALTMEDAEAVRMLRDRQGFGVEVRELVDNGRGYFYVIRLIPELSANRIKLGWTINVADRLAAHRTAAPTAELVQSWPCRKVWELAAMHSVTREGSKHLANEVYECDDVESLVKRCNAFFALMPAI